MLRFSAESPAVAVDCPVVGIEVNMRVIFLFTVFPVFIFSIIPVEIEAGGIAVWAGEHASYREIEQWIGTLADENVSLYLNIRADSLDDPDLLSLIRLCNQEGVEIRGWLVLDYSQGYWPSERNAAEVLNLAEAFLGLVEKNELEVSWISIDMETPIQQMELLSELLSKGEFLKAALLLAGNIGREAYNQAVADYTELVARAHDHGVSVHCVTLPMVLDDFQDYDPSLQDALEIPVLTIPWDEVSVMVYRSLYKELTGFDMGSYLVYEYALDAEYQWGRAASIDLGVVEGEGYKDPTSAASDAGAIKAAEIDKVHFYCLESIMEPGGEGVEWFYAVREAEPDIPICRPSVWLMRESLQFLDLFIH